MKIEQVALALIGVLVLAFIFIIPYSTYKEAKNREACEARGGVYVNVRGPSLCLAKEAFK